MLKNVPVSLKPIKALQILNLGNVPVMSLNVPDVPVGTRGTQRDKRMSPRKHCKHQA